MTTNTAAEPEEWALVKPTLNADDYVPVRIVRRGRRFTFVEPWPGVEWRYTSRGLWGGFPTRAAATVEIDRMGAAAVEYARSQWQRNPDMQ